MNAPTHLPTRRAPRFPWPMRVVAVVLCWGLAGLPIAPVVSAQEGGEDRPRIAVLDFERIGASAEESAAVADQLRNELVNLRTFTVLSRSQIKDILGEQAFQQEGITEEKEAVRAGKLLNAKYIVTGRLNRLSGAYQLNVQMIQVQTAEIVRSEAVLHRGNVLDLLSERIPPVAARLALVEEAPAAARAVPPPPSPAPEPVPQRPAPAPEPEPMAASKPTWPLWVGIPLVILGAAAQANAVSTNDEAETLAQESRDENDPVKYQEAQDKRTEAESAAGGAFLLAAGGIALIAYYIWSDPPGTAALTPQEAYAQAPLQVEVGPGSVMAGWRVRW